MSRRFIFIKLVHSVIAFFLLGCLFYVLYAGVSGTFNPALLVSIAAISIEGIVISLNKWQCPLTILAEKYGSGKGSVTDLFMPQVISRNLFKYAPFVFVAELLLLGFRYFTG